MRRLCLPLSLCLFVLASHSLAAQAKPAPADSAQTIRTNAQIVIVDVTVEDSSGKPVHGLKQSDFTVLEDNAQQQIDHYEERRTPPEGEHVPPAPPLGPGVYTNFSLVPDDGPLNILVLDMLNTPVQNQMDARTRVLDFLKSMKPNRHVAIFGLSSRLFLLQGFTSDPELLKAALKHKNASAQASALLPEPGSSLADQLEDNFGNGTDMAGVMGSVRQFEAEVTAQQTRTRIQATLSSFNQLGRYLSALPGRKNVLWISGSFPLNLLPDGSLTNPFGGALSMQSEYQETTDLLTRGQVVIYPIDARGLMVSPMTDVTNQGSKYVRDPRAFSNDMAKFQNKTIDEHATMLQMADATGGKAYINNNDIAGAVNSALIEGGDYYTMTYSPLNHDWNGRYRKIVVRTNAGMHYTLRYRQGYYASDASRKSRSAGGQVDPFNAAMQRGAPSPTQLLLKVQIVPGTTLEDKVVGGNITAANAAGPYRTYTIKIAGNPGDFTFQTQPDGKRSLSLQLATVIFDRDGKPITALKRPAQAAISAEAYQQILKTGLPYTEQISVPAKGDYFMRIGVEDVYSGKVGALEIPVSSIPQPKPGP